MVIGITGGIGSGKSYVAECFLSFDNTVYYHADKEAKKLMNESQEIKKKVIQEFGADAYKEDQLNRPYIASQVFNNTERLQKLNAIVHPAVKEHFRNFVAQKDSKALIIYENAILFEAKSDQHCNIIITVTAPLEERISRVMSRDGVSREEVLKRVNNQWSDTRKKLLSNYIILNINKKETMLKVQDFYNILTKKTLLF